MQNIAVPLKYLSNIWRTLEMPLTNCEINLILIWSKIVQFLKVIVKVATFAITDTLYSCCNFINSR